MRVLFSFLQQNARLRRGPHGRGAAAVRAGSGKAWPVGELLQPFSQTPCCWWFLLGPEERDKLSGVPLAPTPDPGSLGETMTPGGSGIICWRGRIWNRTFQHIWRVEKKITQKQGIGKCQLFIDFPVWKQNTKAKRLELNSESPRLAAGQLWERGLDLERPHLGGGALPDSPARAGRIL